MRSFTAPELAYLAAADGREAHALIWIRAKNRTTGAIEAMGLWTGEDHASFTVEGQVRTYFGAGNVIAVDDLVYATGLSVQMQSARLSVLTPEVDQLIRGTDARLAPVEIHRAFLSPLTGALVAPPHRLFKGWIEEQPIRTAAKNGIPTLTIKMASAARELTRNLPLLKSDAALRARSPGDGFRRYNSVSGQVETVWGEASGKMGDGAPAAPRAGGSWGEERGS